MTVNIVLRRQLSQLAYFTEGNTPEALVGVPPEWTPDQIGQFQQYWDSLLAGDLGARRHTRFVPGGLEYHPTKDVSLRDNFDDWLARVVCFAFSISPGALVSQMNRATAETQKGAADGEGLAPLKLWVKELVDRLVAEDFGYADIEFGWMDDAPPDAATLMTVNTGYVKAGIKTIDEARAEIGLPPIAGGDIPMIETPTGAVPVGKDKRFNPAEPRDRRGRWTTGQGSTKHIPVQEALPIPEIPEWALPKDTVKPVPQTVPRPDAMPYNIPDDLSDEEHEECEKQWFKAFKFCQDAEANGWFEDPDRHFGRNMSQCMRGQVDERCGGNPTA